MFDMKRYIMNFKSKPYLIFIFTIAFIASCEDSNSKLESEVIGIWHMPQSVNRVMSGMDQSDIGGQSLNASNYSTIITTNTDQKMIDRMSAGVGSISITGMINEELKFLDGEFDPESRSSYVNVTNYDWFSFFEDESTILDLDSPIIILSMSNFSYSEFEMFEEDYLIIYSGDSSYIEITDEIDYQYDGRTLKMPKQSFLSSDSTIYVEGELSYSTIDIKANTPTSIFSFDEEMSSDYGTWSIHIKEDGQWIEVYNWSEVYESSEEEVEDYYSDSTFADWRIEDDQIVVTYKYDEGYVSENDGGFGFGQGTWIYEVRYSYQLSDGKLILTNEVDVCGEWEGTECNNWIEYELGLEEGSLKEIKMVWNLEFTKDATPASRKFIHRLNPILQKFLPFKNF